MNPVDLNSLRLNQNTPKRCHGFYANSAALFKDAIWWFPTKPSTTKFAEARKLMRAKTPYEQIHCQSIMEQSLQIAIFRTLLSCIKPYQKEAFHLIPPGCTENVIIAHCSDSPKPDFEAFVWMAGHARCSGMLT